VKLDEIRPAILEVLSELQRDKRAVDSLQSGEVLGKLASKFQTVGDHEAEGAILAEWQAMFTSGLLIWGAHFRQSEPPFFHISKIGQSVIAELSRDPYNKNGYLANIDAHSNISAITRSYLVESLECYSFNQYKASAVLLGAASERCVLDLRGAVRDQLSKRNDPVPKSLSSQQIKTILSGLQKYFEGNKKEIVKNNVGGHELYSEFEAHWPSFTQQIRIVRNDVGHPNSIVPVSRETVRANFLIFPAVAKMSTDLVEWCNK